MVYFRYIIVNSPHKVDDDDDDDDDDDENDKNNKILSMNYSNSFNYEGGKFFVHVNKTCGGMEV